MGERELLVLCDSETWVGTGRVSILDGGNGQLLFRFDGGPAHFFNRNILAPPTINQFSIQSMPALVRLGDALQPWEGHAKALQDFIITQTFSIAFSGSDRSPIDIVRLSAEAHKRMIQSPNTYARRKELLPILNLAFTLILLDEDHKQGLQGLFQRGFKIFVSLPIVKGQMMMFIFCDWGSILYSCNQECKIPCMRICKKVLLVSSTPG